MGQTSSIELPVELKQKIERAAKDRNEEPATLVAYAIDSLLSADEAQVAEVRRRDAADTSETLTNEAAFAKLDTFRPNRKTPSPQ